jgi:hypothetical protein
MRRATCQRLFSDRTAGIQTSATIVLSSPLVFHHPPVFTTYNGSAWPSGEPLSHFASSSLRPRSLLRVIATAISIHQRAPARPPPPLSELTRRTTVSSSSCGTQLRPESPVSDAGSHRSPLLSSSARAHHR